MITEKLLETDFAVRITLVKNSKAFKFLFIHIICDNMRELKEIRKTHVHIMLDPYLDRMLIDEAKVKGVSKTSIIEDALREHFDNQLKKTKMKIPA